MGELQRVGELQQASIDIGEWKLISVKPRIDSFNQEALMKEIEERVAAGDRYIALDLKGNRFVSLPVIKFCVQIATRLGKEGGSLALIACNERSKRHFEIYGSLSEIQLCQNIKELANPFR